jgi:hypothetical protein
MVVAQSTQNLTKRVWILVGEEEPAGEGQQNRRTQAHGEANLSPWRTTTAGKHLQNKVRHEKIARDALKAV